MVLVLGSLGGFHIPVAYCMNSATVPTGLASGIYPRVQTQTQAIQPSAPPLPPRRPRPDAPPLDETTEVHGARFFTAVRNFLPTNSAPPSYAAATTERVDEVLTGHSSDDEMVNNIEELILQNNEFNINYVEPVKLKPSAVAKEKRRSETKSQETLSQESQESEEKGDNRNQAAQREVIAFITQQGVPLHFLSNEFETPRLCDSLLARFVRERNQPHANSIHPDFCVTQEGLFIRTWPEVFEALCRWNQGEFEELSDDPKQTQSSSPLLKQKAREWKCSLDVTLFSVPGGGKYFAFHYQGKPLFLLRKKITKNLTDGLPVFQFYVAELSVPIQSSSGKTEGYWFKLVGLQISPQEKVLIKDFDEKISFIPSYAQMVSILNQINDEVVYPDSDKTKRTDYLKLLAWAIEKRDAALK